MDSRMSGHRDALVQRRDAGGRYGEVVGSLRWRVRAAYTGPRVEYSSSRVLGLRRREVLAEYWWIFGGDAAIDLGWWGRWRAHAGCWLS